MRILALSDINWSVQRAGTNRLELIKLVSHVQPDLILLAGDLVDNDKRQKGKPGSPYWRDLGYFFDYLETQCIKCCFVRGNWDEFPEYEELAARKYVYIKEISGKLMTVGNVKILGIPHVVTSKRTTMRDITTRWSEPVDIVLTHADGIRRMRLFELPARLIITGHYDKKVSLVRGKLFIAFDQYPGQYSIIQYQPDDIYCSYMIRSESEYRCHNALLKDKQFQWLTPQPPENWLIYGQQMESLLNLKDQISVLDSSQKRDHILKLLQIGIPKAHIREFIPGAAMFLG